MHPLVATSHVGTRTKLLRSSKDLSAAQILVLCEVLNSFTRSNQHCLNIFRRISYWSIFLLIRWCCHPQTIISSCTGKWSHFDMTCAMLVYY